MRIAHAFVLSGLLLGSFACRSSEQRVADEKKEAAQEIGKAQVNEAK